MKTSIPTEVQTIIAVAGRDPQKAVLLAQQLTDLAPFWQYYACGYAYRIAEDFNRALTHFTQAQQALATSDLPAIWQIHCECELQRVKAQTTETTNTEAWHTILAKYQAYVDHAGAAEAAMELVRVLRNRRDNKQAKEFAEAWLTQLNPDQTLVQAYLHRALGSISVDASDFKRAEAEFAQANALFERSGYLIGSGYIKFDRGWMYVVKNRYDLAEQAFREVETVFITHKLNLQQGFLWLNRGILYSMQGRFIAGIHAHNQARNFFTQVNRPIDIATCDMQLAVTFYYARHFASAEGHYRLALPTFEAIQATGRLRMCYINLAQTLAKSGQLEQAKSTLKLLQEHTLILRDNNVQASIFRDVILAEILVQEQRKAEAISLFDSVIQRFNQSSDQIRAAQIQLDRCFLQFESDADSAMFQAQLESLLPKLHDRPMYAWRIYYGLALCAQNKAQALEYFMQASNQIVKMRSSVLIESLSSSIVQPAVEMYAQAVQCALECNERVLLAQLLDEYRTHTFKRLLVSPPAMPYSSRPRAILAQISDLNSQIHDQNNFFDPRLKQQLQQQLQAYNEWILQHRHQVALPDILLNPTDIAEIQTTMTQRYADNWTILKYFWLAPNLVILEINAQQIQPHQIYVNADQQTLLDNACKPESQPLVFDINPHFPDPYQSNREVSQLIFPASIQDRLNHDHRLFIVASGLLHSFPWNLARIQDAWLCERAIVQLIPSLSLLVWTTPDPQSNDMLLVGCSDFGSRHARLAGVEAELNQIKAIYPSQAVQLSAQTTLQQFHTYLEQRYELIHICSHAYVRAGQALASYIAFADDDMLLDEILQIQVPSTQIILSTCSGATSDILPGDENISLPWAWMLAGAAGVVASIWKTGDGQTTDLCVDLHKYYQQNQQQDMPKALANAQRANADPDNWPNWGGFTYTSRYVA